MRPFCPTQQHSALYGISANKIAHWCRVHLTTARRWKRGEYPPYAAVQLVELHSTGSLEIIDGAWAGWFLKNGLLIAPGGDTFLPGDVMAVTFWRALAKHYQAEQRLPRQADWVAGSWVPAIAIQD